MEPVNVGIDFGSTSLKVAYAAAPGEPVHAVRTGSESWDWFIPRRSSTAAIGVELVTPKSTLGSGHGGSEEAAKRFATGVLIAARKAVEAEAGTGVGHAVISVPARYSSSQRVGLRDAALEAGFASVQLITDSVAAVVAHNRQLRQAGTFLTYCVGYAGFELGLVRVVGAHYRSLGYEGGDVLGGAALEEAVLTAWFETLQRLDELGDPRRFGDTTWLQLRAVSQLVKEVLGISEVATFPVYGQRGSWVTFHRAGFESWLRPIVHSTVDQARRLLADAQMTVADVDAVILVGGSTRIPAIAEIVGAELAAPQVTAHLDDLAVGAAVRAAELGARPMVAGTEPDLGAAPLVEEPVCVASEGIPVFTMVTPRVPETSASREPVGIGIDGIAPRPAAGGPTPLDTARRLLEAGHTEQAAELLRGVVDDAQGLLANVATRPAQAGQRSRADKRLGRARQLVSAGRYEEAVSESHIAWRNAPDSVDVFDAMLDVHCDAAMADISIERFADAVRWLRCAYGHDQSNARVRQLLAERTYLHAEQLNDLGRRREAVNAVNESLSLDPDHEKAQQLQQLLARARPTPQPGAEG